MPGKSPVKAPVLKNPLSSLVSWTEIKDAALSPPLPPQFVTVL